MNTPPIAVDLVRSAAPATTPVTTADVREALRIDAGESDALLTRMIEAATALIEAETGRALIDQTWIASVAGISGTAGLMIPRSPISAITAIDYYDPDGSAQSAVLSDFRLYHAMSLPVLAPVDGATWPALGTRPDVLQITFTAGYGAAADVPVRLRQAILLLVGLEYQTREAGTIANGVRSAVERPFGVQRAIDDHRLGWVAA